jgi:pimeloyl-ACP methyl ester carboxylesterase
MGMSALGSTLQDVAIPAAIGPIAALRGGTPGGLPVIALHGWLDNAASFVPLAAHLPVAWDFIAMDLPGHGRSPHLGAGAEYTLGTAINAVLDVADAQGWTRFHLLGHSMGGGIASLIAAACPQRVRALVAIEALGALGEAVENTAERLRDGVSSARERPNRRLRRFADLAGPVRARMQANALSQANARLLVERGVRAMDEGYIWSTDQRLTLPTLVRQTQEQAEALLAAIECPVQVIFAEPAQAYFPEDMRRRRVAQLRDGRLALLPGTHHLHMEDPQPVAQIVREFLAPFAAA